MVKRNETGQILGVQRVSPEDLETLDILSDQAFSKRLSKSVQQAREGRTASSTEVRKRLGLSEVPYVIAADDLELLHLAIERYRATETNAEFEEARLYATGVNLRLLRVRPELDRELVQAYSDACDRLGRNPEAG